jgi:glycosyltransferase involved in cell wall biosynthesis
MSEVSRWQEQELITYLGHVEDMPALLRGVDVVVLPSYREGVPRSLLEAAACGLPIIASDVPGCREVVKHGVNGLLVPPRDAVALACAIRHLQQDPETRRRMGAAGREAVVRDFNEHRVLSETFAVYRELLAAPV